MDRIAEIWARMNESEKFGCQFGLFPSWVLQDYKLNKEETVKLIEKGKPNINKGGEK